MKKILALLLLFTAFTGCTNDDTQQTPAVVTEVFHCKILKAGKITISNSSGDQMYYNTEYVYANNKIVKRLHYQNPNSGLYYTDSIAYDALGRATKIFYDFDHRYDPDHTTTDTFRYLPNSNVPYQRQFEFVYLESGTISMKVENITYDTVGRILQTQETQIYPEDVPDAYHNVTTHYTYLAGNLAKVVEITHDNQVPVQTATYTYSNFDTHKNPFRSLSVPFTEMRHLKYSRNNRQKIEYTSFHEGWDHPDSQWQTTYGNFEYNEFDYPLIAEYQCQ